MSKSLPSPDAPSAVRRLMEDDRGNIAVIFAIALLPIMGFVGAAVDYSRASNTRTAMQSALDSAALMVSKDNASGDLSASQLTTKAQTYFNALFPTSDAQNIAVTATYSNANGAGQTLKMTGSGQVNTQFLKVAGFPSIGINTNSTTTWGTTKLRVALALDNTGSMAEDGKMTALQGAAKNLVDQLSKSAQNEGDVLISVVPFATDVNIGTSFKNSAYMDWSNWSLNDTILNVPQYPYNTQRVRCGGSNGTFTMKCGTANNNINKWNGCVMDRANYVTQIAPLSGAGTVLAANQSPDCPEAMMPLSSSWATIKTTIGNMSPSGATNQLIGFEWGWQTLRPNDPMNAPAEDPNFTYKKAIILLSDGRNTQTRDLGSGRDKAENNAARLTIDDRQRLLCQAIKDDGITIYTIQVNTDGDETSSVLNACASSPDNFFMLTSANQVLSAFDTIGTSLRRLRIAK